ncbi:MAG TPA: UDP-N-acetylmuramate--L-alanine ligase [Candidatus Saccharimonadales bacterium]|nr:UDP-N-acetylmuramate--L-alanine ligase [Candidatus Saccharimonadales bacterium]
MYRGNEHIHFMGIGGIGMSGIAKILIKQGYRVSGCDSLIDQTAIKELKDLGCIIAPAHQHEICNDLSINILVHTSAILKTNPEIIAAQRRGIPVIARAMMLAEIMRTKYCIAVAGSHGKTTTSSLLSHLLVQAQLDPTIVVGGYIHSIGSNAVYGQGSLLVAEADESDRSFLLLPKTFSIVTNIDLEHLETYQDFTDIKNTFVQFMNQIPLYGCNVICIDDAGIQEIIPQLQVPYITYGTHDQADFQARNIVLLPDGTTFDIFDKKKNHIIDTIAIPLPGIHNVLNALGVITLALHVGIPPKTIKNALGSFTGVDRRFTSKGITKRHGALIFDDYGHHPLEVHHTLEIARKKAPEKLVVVFQPHRFTRTKHLWTDFVHLFATHAIDELIITDIFPASEQPIEGITSQRLVAEIKARNPALSIFYYPFETDGSAIIQHLHNVLQKNDLVLLQGAGKANKIAKDLLA